MAAGEGSMAAGIGVHGGVLLLSIAAVFVAGSLQSITGVGFALLAVPLLSLALPPATAVVAVFFLGASSSLLTLLANHDAIVWVEARRLSLGAVVAMPAGAVLLVHTSPATLRAILGVSTCAVAVWMLLPTRTVERTPAPRPVLSYVAGACSGVLNTSLATNGPPLVAYLRTRQLPPKSFRSTISVVFSISNVVGLGILFGVGAVHRTPVVLFAVTFLPGLFGWAIGQRLATKIPAHAFDRMVDGLLLVSGILALAKAVAG